MVKLFRNSNPGIFALLIIYGVILKIPVFLHQPPIFLHSAYPLTDMVIYWVNKVYTATWLQTAIALFLTFAQAFYLNYFLNDIRFIPKTTFLPAFVFVLLSSLFNQLSFFSPQLLSLCFLLPILHNTYLFYKKENASGLLFDTAFMTGILCLLYFPAIIFIIFLLGSLLTTRRFSIKEWSLCLLGFLIPFILVIAYLYWTDDLKYINSVVDFSRKYFLTISIKALSLQLTLTLAMLFLLFVWSFLVIRQNFFKTLVQWRIYINVTLWFLVCGTIGMIFGLQISPASLWLIIIPLSAMIGYNFSELKQVRWAEYAHLLVILLILVFNFKFLIRK